MNEIESSKKIEDLYPYSIEDLETKTQVSKRNIRYLISMGVVEEPKGQKRWASYGESHLRALEIYTEMKNKGINSLEVIKNRIQNSDLDNAYISINEIEGVELKISQQTINKIGVDNLIEELTKLIKEKTEKKGE